MHALKKLGFRSLIDVIPTDPSIVRGSYGRLPDSADDGPIFVSSMPFGTCGPEPTGGTVEMTSVFERTLAALQR